MNYANYICDNITMLEVLEKYGYSLNRKNTMLCPFHTEKTPSFKIYHDNQKWKCFGCNEGGSVIDFVMKLFNLDYSGAITRINYDFRLNLPIRKKPTYRDRIKMRHSLAERKAKRREERIKKEQANIVYWAIFDEWKRLSDNKIKYAPKTQDEQLHPLFIEALQKLSYTEHLLNIAEVKRGEADG